MTPYTYLVGWGELDRWYYGVRFAANCHPLDLMTSYFTSSKVVQRYIEEHGLPDVVMVDKVFASGKEAREYETAYLTENSCHRDARYLNRTTNRAIAPTPEMYIKAQETQRRKYGKNFWTGRPKSDAAKAAQSFSMKQRWKNDVDGRVHLGKIVSERQRGSVRPREFGEKISSLIWVTDGISDRRVPAADQIPDGFRLGRGKLKGRTYKPRRGKEK